MGSFTPSDALGALLAALSGVIVALFTSYLEGRRAAAGELRMLSNARALLALEVRANRAALTDFWKTITALAIPDPQDSDAPVEQGKPAAPGSWEELTVMFRNGLASYSAPTWSTTRWNGIEPHTIGALSPSEMLALDNLHRALDTITDLYRRLSVITPADEAKYDGRFGVNRLASYRLPLYIRLRAAVSQVLDMPDPLPGAVPTGK